MVQLVIYNVQPECSIEMPPPILPASFEYIEEFVSVSVQLFVQNIPAPFPVVALLFAIVEFLMVMFA